MGTANSEPSKTNFKVRTPVKRKNKTTQTSKKYKKSFPVFCFETDREMPGVLFPTFGADNSDLSFVMQQALEKGVRIMENMTDYIVDNNTDYPTYDSDKNPLNDTTIRNGIIL